ncbi:MAG TPA: hypothetical protein VF867_18745 [Arthrobacter sp.]
MTATITPVSPKDLIAAHKRTERTIALTQGSPTNRSTFPGIGLEPTGMIFLRGKRLTYQSMNSMAQDLDHATLTMLLSDPDKITVIADSDTRYALQAVAETEPTEGYNSIKKRLKTVASLPGSMRLPVLTDALSYRYWLPEGLDEDSLSDWADAFGAKGPTMSLTMKTLIELATSGKHPEGLGYTKTITSLQSTEVRLMEQCVWGNISSDVQVFGMLESYTSKINSLRTIDPGLLELHVLDGRVCRIKPMNVETRTFTASVSQPFKLKEGRALRMTDGHVIVETTMESLRYGAGELHAVFEQPSSRGKGATLVASAKSGAMPLYVTDGTFDMRASFPKNKRWLSGSVDRISGRDVPLDVILAGAPVA